MQNRQPVVVVTSVVDESCSRECLAEDSRDELSCSRARLSLTKTASQKVWLDPAVGSNSNPSRVLALYVNLSIINHLILPNSTRVRVRMSGYVFYTSHWLCTLRILSDCLRNLLEKNNFVPFFLSAANHKSRPAFI